MEEQLNGSSKEVNSEAPLAFYVRALMPPVEVSTVVVGSKVRSMSEIPGRRISQRARETVETDEGASEQVGGLFCLCTERERVCMCVCGGWGGCSECVLFVCVYVLCSVCVVVCVCV